MDQAFLQVDSQGTIFTRRSTLAGLLANPNDIAKNAHNPLWLAKAVLSLLSVCITSFHLPVVTIWFERANVFCGSQWLKWFIQSW